MVKEEEAKAWQERNLLFGVLAVQLHFLEPLALAQVASVFVSDPRRDLGEVLVEKGLLKPSDREILNLLLERQLEAHGGNAAAGLASLGGNQAIHESFSAALVRDREGHLEPLSSFGGEPSVTEGQVEETGFFLEDARSITVEHPGRYQILGEYKRGGIGRILIARDRHLGREVAIKELLPEKDPFRDSPLASPPKVTMETLSRFLREARITGQLGHPSIVPVYELARRSDGTIFYTMRLIHGKTLAESLQECHSFSDRLQLLPYFLDVCNAMAYAHSKRVIHRDLKPHNIVIGEFGETIVLDWGLAKFRGQTDMEEDDQGEDSDAQFTVPGKAIGTPSYMSPEQAEGRKSEVDERSDVWSLGVILYELLTGRLPFLGFSRFEVMERVAREEPPPVKELEPEAPPELCAIVERCLQKPREKRYRNAKELAEALSQVLLVLFGPVSFIRVREERNLAVEQKLIIEEQRKVAEEQRALAEAREREARRNLAEAYFQYGLQAEREKHYNDARVFFAKALALTGREDARSALYREAVQPLRPILERTLVGHQERVSAVAFSPDNRSLISGSWDETMKLWSLATGECLHTFHGHEDWVTSVAFSPDGKWLLSGSSDFVHLWSIASGECVRKFTGHQSQVMAVAFSPDGQFALSAGVDETIKLWSLNTGECRRTFVGHQDWINALAFSPDGKFVVSGSRDNTLKLWSLAEGECGLENWKQTVLSGGAKESGCLMTLEGHAEEITSVAFDLDNRYLLSASRDRSLKLWLIATGECVATFSRPEGEVYGAAFHPAGEVAVSGGEDRALSLWSLHPPACLRRWLAHEERVASLAVSPDGKYIASGSWDKTIKLWSILSREVVSELRGHEAGVTSLAVSSEGKWLASGGEDKKVKLWSLANLELTKSLVGHDSQVSAVAFSPGGEKIASASWDNLIKVWAAETGECLLTLEEHEDDVLALAVDPGGKFLLSASYDNTVKLWDLETGKCLRTFTDYQHPIQCVAFSHSGKFFLTGSCAEREQFDCVRSELKLWDLESGKCQKQIPAHEHETLWVEFSPDDKFALSTSLETIKVWDLESGECRRTLRGHKFWVRAAAFSPDGKYLVSGGDDRALRIWSRETGECLLTLPPHREPITSLCLSPEGAKIIAAGKDHVIRIFPFPHELLEISNQEIFEKAQEEVGLKLEGFELSLFKPD